MTQFWCILRYLPFSPSSIWVETSTLLGSPHWSQATSSRATVTLQWRILLRKPQDHEEVPTETTAPKALIAHRVSVIMVISGGTTTHLLWRALNLVVAKKIMKVQDEQIVEYRNEMQKHRIKM